jgi:hypothetical protein
MQKIFKLKLTHAFYKINIEPDELLNIFLNFVNKFSLKNNLNMKGV